MNIYFLRILDGKSILAIGLICINNKENKLPLDLSDGKKEKRHQQTERKKSDTNNPGTLVPINTLYKKGVRKKITSA